LKHRTTKDPWFEFTDKLIKTAYAIFREAEVPITEKGASDPKVLAMALLARTLSHFKSVVALTRKV
jgi:hypothetical protein